jgi:NodT family efflux transporter outer membrane factor (OMF) lipoprotein
MIARALSVLLVLGLSACVVGPNFKQPAAPKAQPYTADQSALEHGTAGTDQKLVAGGKVSSDWWTMFGSQALNKLVERGLANSLTVAAARAKLAEVQENLNAQVGAVLYPSVDAKFSSSRQKISGASYGGTSHIYSLHNASVTASYGIDLFGASRRYLEGLEAQIDYQQYQLQAARMTLAANIVTAVVKEASLRAQIAATQQIIADSEAQLKLTEQRYDIGVVAQSDVLAQRSALARNRTALPVLQKQLQQNRHLLNVLVGDLPADAGLAEFSLAELHLPHELPLSLPSELVRQRPDIMASEALLHQASADIGVATANMYPSITLSASYGSDSSTISQLFQGGTNVWGVAASLVQPLFHGGELRAKKRAAVDAYQQAQANYREVVLNSFRDVADTLQALDSDGQSLQLQLDAERAAHDTYNLVQEQYKAGAANYLELVNARQQYQQAVITRTQAEAARYADSAALILALGGGWWNADASGKVEPAKTAETGMSRPVAQQQGVMP